MRAYLSEYFGGKAFENAEGRDWSGVKRLSDEWSYSTPVQVAVDWPQVVIQMV